MHEFQPFVMERMMSKHEQDVDYNLSESGVHPILLGELLDRSQGALERLLSVDLNYPHANGIPSLRENIARHYPGAGPDNVLTTVGAIEANYNTLWALLDPGDEIAVMLPNYMQVWGMAKNRGLAVKTFRLQEEEGWTLDAAELESVVTAATKMIAVCNPNNPTGRILSEKEMDQIVAAAERVGCWILADEVYRGAERSRQDETPSFYGRYDKVVATGSMSKSYGLPGLRLGWAVAPEPVIDELWARHEYTTISAGMLDNHLASLALSADVRPGLIARTRDYIRRGYPILEKWMNEHPGMFHLTPPDAAAICFVRYDLDINSTALVDLIREQKSVLIVPGDHFGIDRCLRISFGLPHDYLTAALDRIHETIESLTTAPV